MIKNKNIHIILISLFIVGSSSLFLSGCSDVVDELERQLEYAGEEDENVLSVKNASPSTHPNITYGKSFDNFFGSPKWRYFKGTQNGPDDDGDGKPDYQLEDIDVVEFSGKCTYADVDNVTALIQFVLDKDEGTFRPVYLSLNKLPQNNLVLLGLLESVFSNAEEDLKQTEIPKQSEVPKQTEIPRQTKTTPSAFISSAEIVGVYTDYGDGYMYKLNVNGSFSSWIASIICNDSREFTITYTSDEIFNNPYFTEGSSINSIKAKITPFDEDGNAGQTFTTIWNPNRVEKLEDYSYDASVYLTGEINAKGGNIVGYSTSYVCNNGEPEKVRTNLGDGWRVTAYDHYYSYGIDWYELYDTDDGDYYGWVDGNYITWY